MPKYNFWCLSRDCSNRCLNTVDIPDDEFLTALCPECKQPMKFVGRPAHGVRPDYSDISNFGKPQYADARRRACGMSGEVPPDTFHKDDIQ